MKTSGLFIALSLIASCIFGFMPQAQAQRYYSQGNGSYYDHRQYGHGGRPHIRSYYGSSGGYNYNYGGGNHYYRHGSNGYYGNGGPRYYRRFNQGRYNGGYRTYNSYNNFVVPVLPSLIYDEPCIAPRVWLPPQPSITFNFTSTRTTTIHEVDIRHVYEERGGYDDMETHHQKKVAPPSKQSRKGDFKDTALNSK